MRMTSRYFFVHLQKTGGTSLLAYLRDVFDEDQIFPSSQDRGMKSIMFVDYLYERAQKDQDKIQVFKGHFPYWVHEGLGSDIRTFTILREPVARTLSFLRHQKKMAPEKYKDKSLMDIYKEPLRFHGLIHNHMVKMFALTSKDGGMMTRIDFSDEHLKRAKRNLRQVDVIGIQEEFDPFLSRLTDQFGWNFPKDYRRNVSEDPEVLPESFIQQIRRDNQLDMRFYRFACELIAKRDARRQKK